MIRACPFYFFCEGTLRCFLLSVSLENLSDLCKVPEDKQQGWVTRCPHCPEKAFPIKLSGFMMSQPQVKHSCT